MVNIAELLKKSIEKQNLKPTSEVRQHIYEKARSAIKSKLDEMDAPELVQRSYLLQLEAAICEVESFYVLEPEFFELSQENVSCHFAYHAYLPDYFGTKQDVAIDMAKLRPLTESRTDVKKLEQVGMKEQPSALESDAEIRALHEQKYNLQAPPDRTGHDGADIADKPENKGDNPHASAMNNDRDSTVEPLGANSSNANRPLNRRSGRRVR